MNSRSYTLGVSLISSLICTQASGAIVEGVELPNRISVGNSSLVLNGAGVRKATLFKVKVYVAGLYLESPSKDPQTILSSNQIKKVELRFVHDVPKDKLVQAWNESFEKNCGTKCEALKPALVKLNSSMTNFSSGDKLAITFFPNSVDVAVNNLPPQKIESQEYSKVLLSTWLGANPPNEDLKSGMLGLK